MSPSPRARRALGGAGEAVEATLWVVATAAALRVRGPRGAGRLTRAARRLGSRRASGADGSGDATVTVDAAVHAVDRAAARLPLRSPCLVRSCAAQAALARRGIASDLRVGVRVGGDRLAAHAWLEHAGRVVNDDAEACAAFAAFVDPVDLDRSTVVGRR